MSSGSLKIAFLPSILSQRPAAIKAPRAPAPKTQAHRVQPCKKRLAKKRGKHEMNTKVGKKKKFLVE